MLAMHIYYSALPFAPCDTALFRTYNALDLRKIKVVGGIQRDWDPLIAVLRGHAESVLSITFSADGSRLASASEDNTVQLWNSCGMAERGLISPPSRGILARSIL
jgi:WD40 repeat protein